MRAARHDVQSVFGLELQVAQRGPEHHALDLRAGVLQREVQVTRGPHLGVRELAFNPDFGKGGFEELTQRARQLTDRHHSARGNIRRASGRPHRLRFWLGLRLFEGKIEQGAHEISSGRTLSRVMAVALPVWGSAAITTA